MTRAMGISYPGSHTPHDSRYNNVLVTDAHTPGFPLIEKSGSVGLGHGLVSQSTPRQATQAKEAQAETH